MSRDASSTSLSDRLKCQGATRRGLLGLGAAGLLGLTGCGFRPLYGEQGSLNSNSPVSAELAAVEVANVPERRGQLLRRALRERLWAGGQASPRYTLTTSLQIGTEPEGYRTDGLPTRVRYTVNASWWLVTRDAQPQIVLNGTERAVDAFNIPDNQFFAGDASSEAMMGRLMERLADDIVTRLAVELQERSAV